jgi:hypothetical protein
MGVGASGAGYIPFATNDSSGVQPNLAFDINGTDYYTTGNIRYTGVYPTTQMGSDSTNIWVKRGFVYLTGPAQTSLTLSIRNNAPGGGGNDWALDDISLATCLPNMQYSPSLSPNTCIGNPITINDTIRSYFNNYVYYKWQRSTDGGSSWSDVTGALGPSSPTWNGSAWEYITSYTVPVSATNLSDSGNKYRVVVATTLSNLSNSSCLFTDGISIINLNVIDCEPVLGMSILSVNGKLVNNHGNLSWTTNKESEPFHFDIERSDNGINFTVIGTVSNHNDYNAETNRYLFNDPSAAVSKVWYRVAIVNKGEKKYSRIILLNNHIMEFGLNNVVNPFHDQLDFEVLSTENTKVNIALANVFGNNLKQETIFIYEGVTSISLPNTEALPPGIYILQVRNKEKTISKKIVKK